MTAQTHSFQAEVSQVLSLVVNSLYSNKEIFLRELVSNASDALDKLRFRALSDPSLMSAGEALKIRLIPDEAAGTLTIEDNGIGMSAQELIDNLGTIARSGTRDFTEELKKAADAEKNGNQALIGQCGVGFYSAFLVADKVEVISRAAGQTAAHRWESEAKDAFIVEEAERAEHGTTVILHLKDEHKNYAKGWTLRDVVRRHSDYVGHPIELIEPAPPKSDADAEEDASESSDSGDGLKTEVINQANALWRRAPNEVEEDQYKDLYKHLAHDWENPLSWKHFRIEGTQMFSGIVFLPATTRAELLDPRGDHGVRLHVKRILAMESCEELLPKWLRFVRGVVDSEDLPLNVSRETLQDSRAVKIMKKQVVTQILGMIEELEKERPDDYRKFWDNFGAVFKEGLYFEPEYKDRIAKLLRFQSSHTVAADANSWTSLSEYVGRMKEGQHGIFYIEGATVDVLAQSPQLEALKKKGYEVIFMTDGVDPFALEKFTEFEGHRLVDAMSEDLDIGDEGPKEKTDALSERFKEVLGDKVSEVRFSSRLAESPACLVTQSGGLPPHMQAMFKAQNLDVPNGARILELNSTHPIIESLRAIQAKKPDAAELSDWMEVLHDQALIAEGSAVTNPAALAKRLTALLTGAAAQAASAT